MQRTRPRLSAYFLLSIVVLAVLACGYAYNTLLQFPNQAEVLFGQPSIHLSTWQHYLISYRLVNNRELLLKPLGSTSELVTFSIEVDQSADSIISDLAASGLIDDTALFRDYLIYSGLDTQLQAGTYQINRGLSAVEIADTLLDSTPLIVTVSILPGWRLEEIAESLPTTGLEISPEQFIQAANQRYPALPIMREVPVGASLEGFFPPGMYQIERTISAEQLVIFLLEQFEQTLPPKTLEGIEQQGLSLHQALIIASIIEREAVNNDEMPIIASVFYNRLAISMKLETDPTVQYALGFNSAQNTWWTNPLTYTDLEYLSPYNTYIHFGFPPTPIANPSLAALQAVAFPAQTPYFYFRAACDDSGRHNFSENYNQHLEFACP